MLSQSNTPLYSQVPFILACKRKHDNLDPKSLMEYFLSTVLDFTHSRGKNESQKALFKK